MVNIVPSVNDFASKSGNYVKQEATFRKKSRRVARMPGREYFLSRDESALIVNHHRAIYAMHL